MMLKRAACLDLTPPLDSGGLPRVPIQWAKSVSQTTTQAN